MKALATVLVLVFGVTLGLAVMSWANAYQGEFGSPSTPQNIQDNIAFAHFDVQAHNRDGPIDMDPMQAQHGGDCSAPPNTHPVSSMAAVVYVCADHVMTALNTGGYGMIALTPTQLLNCANSCTVQFDMSTEEQSSRDWWALDLTPWADNLTLPFDTGDVDLQGPQRNGVAINGGSGNGRPLARMYSNGNRTYAEESCAWTGTECGSTGAFVTAGTNQAAVRQTFKLTLTPGHFKFERLASATGPAVVFFDDSAPVLLAPDYIVQFEHHSYTPTKDGAGVPQTWHWGNFVLSPSSPFTMIHAQPRVIQGDGTITFNSPTPANAFLRFSAVCKMNTNASGSTALAPKAAYLGHPEHVAPYFIPIQAGRTSVSVSFASDDWYNGPCWAQDFHVWSKGGGGPLPTPTPSLPTPTATAVPPTPTGTVPPATPTPSVGTAVTFDNLSGQDQPLNGQYPTGLINWGSNKWWLAAPWPPHSTKSISFNNGTGTSRTFAFVSPHVLVSLKAGGVSPSTITLACAGNTNKVQAIPANTLTTIATGWTVPCTTVTVSSTNGWDTNFDDLLVQ